MHELGLTIANLVSWFPSAAHPGYTLVNVPAAESEKWAQALGEPLRRCYISDELLDGQEKEHAAIDVIKAVLPDPGSTRSGDFGEILVLLYNAAAAHPTVLVSPKRWRLKQDRNKPAPHSDVLNFVLPSWPNPSADDTVICSEVKAKATDQPSIPIASAIEDCAKDRTSRLAKTLQWLKERALRGDLVGVSIPQLDRFIKATEALPAKKRFQAVAVVCQSLVAGELATAPTTADSAYSLVIISVPQLQKVYTEVFEAAVNSRNKPATA